jgi:hypothetical protein
MDEKQRAILGEVAEGRLSPEEAAVLLQEVDEAEQAERPAERPAGVRRVRVVGALQLTRVVGDPTVREAVAEGPHAAQREGDTLVIRGEADAGGAGFTFGPRSWGLNLASLVATRPARLTVRMHPELALEAELGAGALSVDGVSGPLRVEVEAGSARIERFRGPLDLAVEAGAVQASGVLDQGASRIRCESGSVRVHLEQGSSVRIRAAAELGRVALPGGSGAGAWTAGGGTREAVVGAGAASLDVRTELGSVAVTADEEPA